MPHKLTAQRRASLERLLSLATPTHPALAESPASAADPLGLTPETKEELLLFREAELAHGRVAMMGATPSTQPSLFTSTLMPPEPTRINLRAHHPSHRPFHQHSPI